MASWAPTGLELTERLEQLRALEHGMKIHLVVLNEAPLPGVDTPEDLERLVAFVASRKAAGVAAGAAPATTTVSR